jgi:hypothetical protein
MRPLPKKLLVFVLAVAPLLPSVSLRADTIAEYIEGTGEQISADYRGQSFTTSPGGPFNNAAFNFFSASMTSPIGHPYASGTAFLFSMPFAGGPADMSSMSPGFLGQATAPNGTNEGVWTFDPGMTLLGDTQYYFYMRTLSSLITGGGTYAGGNGYIVSGCCASDPWQANSNSYNFRVTVPETGRPLWLLALSAFGLFGLHRLTRIWTNASR